MSSVLRFDCFEVDLAAARLFKRGSRIHLREQSFQVLALLLERPGEVVSRDDLRRRLWPTDVFIDFENSLNTAVARLREAIGDSAERPRFVETLPRHGYRFIGTISGSVPADGPSTKREPDTRADAPRGVQQRLSRDPIACSECDLGLRLLDRMTGIVGGFDEARAHLEKAVARDPASRSRTRRSRRCTGCWATPDSCRPGMPSLRASCTPFGRSRLTTPAQTPARSSPSTTSSSTTTGRTSNGNCRARWT